MDFESIMKQKFGILGLVIFGLIPVLGVQFGTTLAIVAFVAAAALGLTSLYTENTWPGQSTIALAVVYIGFYIAWLILKSKLATALGAFGGLAGLV